jgi:hypothetical protein
MSLKNRVGNFLILFGVIGLMIFVASVLAPPEEFDARAFLGGVVLVGVGVSFRLSKSRGVAPAGPPPAAPQAAPAPPDRPKKRGLFATILKGPANKNKTAPADPKQLGGAKSKGGGGRVAGGRK